MLVQSKMIILFFVFISLVSLVAANNAKSQSTFTVYINPDGSISGTDNILRNGNLYFLTGNLSNSPIVILCSNIILDGKGFTLQGAGGWGIPGAAGKESTAAINLTCTNVTVQNFDIAGWEVGVLGAYDSNTISNNTIAETDRAVAIYAANNDITANYLSNNLYGVRLQGNNNCVSQNQLVDNYGGIMISFSNGTVITRNFFRNNSSALNVDDSSYEIHENNFEVNASARIVTTAGDALHFGGGTIPTWDNGEVGNYWSDYAAKYPNAAEIDHTGIGDTPYLIRTNPVVVDRFPLLSPVNISQASAESPTPSASPGSTPSPKPSGPSESPTPATSPSNSQTPTPTTESTSPPPATPAQNPTTSPNQTKPQNLPTEQLVYGVAAAAIAVGIIAVALLLQKRRSGKT